MGQKTHQLYWHRILPYAIKRGEKYIDYIKLEFRSLDSSETSGPLCYAVDSEGWVWRLSASCDIIEGKGEMTF
jgi:hypothetical protein